MYVSNDLSWRTQLHGNNKTGKEKITGLLTKLSQRVGMLKRLSKVIPTDRLKDISEGIFTSKLIYCLQLFGNVWGLPTLDENNRRFSAFTKEDNRKLQSLQNQVMRIKSGLPRDTPLTQLLKASNDLSVMQLTAYLTLTTTHKTISTGQPGYLAGKLKLRTNEGGGAFPHRQLNTIEVPQVNLTLSRGGFVFRAATLWNMLPSHMRAGMKTTSFKTALHSWIRSNIRPKPP